MSENKEIMARLARLREKMGEYGIDYYLMPTSDYHNSEYAADFFKAREYFTGFTGSNGTVVVSKDWAGLWTDGRYFIQAAKEIEGTGVTLYKMGNEGVPTIEQYLHDHVKEGETLGFDGMVVPAGEGEDLAKAIGWENENSATHLRFDRDLAGEVWSLRPALPCHDIYVLSDELCGKSFQEKLADVREQMAKNGAKQYLLSKLDDICWLTNLRGNDVECNPVMLSYAFVTEESFTLFVQDKEITEEVRNYCTSRGILLKDYKEIVPFISSYEFRGKIQLDANNTSFGIYQTILANAGEKENLVNVPDPTTLMKAMKNETELSNIRQVYLRDSAALCKFIYWLKNTVGKEEITEYSAAMHLDHLREELPGFIELSFPTISAYNANAAMMHYEATETDYSEVKKEGMLLVDSGGTYMGGTTDVTRTIVVGSINEEIRKHFTAVAVSMLRLANTNFLYGCTGRNLDIVARGPIWDMNMDYKCGTGHGIGYMLNVHEGPQNIRWAARKDAPETPLEKGMIVSDEPGVYVEGSHGIRTENILEVVEGEKNGDGQFMHFRHLTYVPIDLEAIDPRFMEPRDIAALNAYHEAVYEKISPLIEEKEIREWLRDMTRAID